MMPSPNNLPLQLTSFIGREREIAEVKRLLASSRLLTLTGSGGSGKTRLAVQIASQLLDEYPDGVFFVNLAPITDHNLVVSSIAQALDVKEATGQPLVDTLKTYLQNKELLLLLDNFEQVVDAAPLVLNLLLSAPSLKALVTSRRPLHLQGEQLYDVPPLQLPNLGRKSPPVDDFTRYESVVLFVQRAQSVSLDFRLTSDNADAVAEICTRLDGLPLAIELAASRIKLFTPQAMLSRLDRRLPFLVGGPRDLPSRQQTLRGAIEWSYDLLSDGEQKLFRRLAVFHGGRSLEAIEAVCNIEDDLCVDVLEALGALVSQSLVRQREDAGGEPRFWMLETIHEYAREKLGESGEVETLEREHALYFMRLAEAAEPHLTSKQQQHWLQRLEDEYDNLRAALAWAGEQSHQGSSLEAAEIGLRTGGALWGFWYVRGLFTEGREHLERTLSVPEALLQACSPGSRARGLNGAGVLAWRQGDYSSARSLAEAALVLGREAGDKQSMSLSLNNLGNVASEQGDYTEARALCEESLTLRREIGDKSGIAASLNNLANVTHAQGDYASARALYKEGLALRRELGNKAGIAASLNNLGGVACEQGDYTEARALCEESLILRRELGDKKGIAESLAGLGGVAVGIGQAERGTKLLGAIEGLLGSIGAVLDREDRLPYERAVVSVRSLLGNEAFERAWQYGLGMSMDKAIAYALEEVAGPEPHILPRPLTLSYPYELTKREVELLGLLVEGLTNEQIAQRLFLSPNTVRAHLHSIYSKLDVGNRGAAARFATENNLV